MPARAVASRTRVRLCKGAYLEPDRHFGHAYLAETRRVLAGLAPDMNMESFDNKTGTTPKLTRKHRVRRTIRLTLNFAADCAEALAWKLRGR